MFYEPAISSEIKTTYKRWYMNVAYLWEKTFADSSRRQKKFSNLQDIKDLRVE